MPDRDRDRDRDPDRDRDRDRDHDHDHDRDLGPAIAPITAHLLVCLTAPATATTTAVL